MNRTIRAFAFTTLFSIAGCSTAEQPLNQNSQNPMIKLDNLQDWCVGRYTFKLPKEASLIGGTNKYNYYIIDSKINAQHSDLQAAYQAQLTKFSNKNTRILQDPVEQKSGNKIIKLFFAKYGTDNRGSINVFAWVLDNKTLFSISGTYSAQYKQIGDEAINNLVNNISSRRNNTIPNQKGICITNGFIADSGTPFRDNISSLGFDFKKYPSLRVFIESENTTEQQTDLIERMKANLKGTGHYDTFKNNTKTIRQGSVTQKDGDHLKGSEWLYEVNMTGKPGMLGQFEYSGQPNNSLDTLINLQVDSSYDMNVNKTSSLPTADTIRLYETIINSIKKF